MAQALLGGVLLAPLNATLASVLRALGFSDARAVRGAPWLPLAFCLSADDANLRKPPAARLEHLGELLAWSASRLSSLPGCRDGTPLPC